MKKSVKIITLVLSLALALCAAVGFAVSAETAESTTTAPVVLKKNVMSNGNFCLMFALDPASCGDNIIVEAYNTVEKNPDDPEANRFEYLEIDKAEALNSEQNIDVNEDGVNDEVVMIQTQVGVSASDIADTWHVYFTSNGQTTHVEYSVKDYAFERLYADFTILENDSTTKAYRQKQFYLSILEIGSTAQNLLVNWDKNTDAPVAAPERLAKEYSYASIQGGTFNDGLTGSYVEKGDTLTLTQSADNTEASWKVYTYDTNGNLVGDPATVEITDGSATVTVEGNTVIIPGWAEGLTPGKYFVDLGDSAFNFDNVTDYTELGMAVRNDKASRGHYGIVAMEGRGNVFNVGKDGVTEISKSGVWVPVVDTANGEGNCVAIEFDVQFNGSMSNVSTLNSKNVAQNYCTLSSGETVYFYNSIVPFLLTGTASDKPTSTSSSVFSGGGLYAMSANASFDESTNIFTGEAEKMTFAPLKTSTTSIKESKCIELGKWYNICIEVYSNSGSGQINFKVYVDGVYVHGSYYGSTSTTVNPMDAGSLLIDIQDSFNPCEIYIDNLFAGKIVKDYE